MHPNSVESNASEHSGIKGMKNIFYHQLGPRSSPRDSVFSLVLVKDTCFVLLQFTLTKPNRDAIFEPLNVSKWWLTLSLTKELYVL